MTVPDRARPVARASTAEVCFNMNVDIVLSPWFLAARGISLETECASPARLGVP